MDKTRDVQMPHKWFGDFYTYTGEIYTKLLWGMVKFWYQVTPWWSWVSFTSFFPRLKGRQPSRAWSPHQVQRRLCTSHIHLDFWSCLLSLLRSLFLSFWYSSRYPTSFWPLVSTLFTHLKLLVYARPTKTWLWISKTLATCSIYYHTNGLSVFACSRPFSRILVIISFGLIEVFTGLLDGSILGPSSSFYVSPSVGAGPYQSC